MENSAVCKLTCIHGMRKGKICKPAIWPNPKTGGGRSGQRVHEAGIHPDKTVKKVVMQDETVTNGDPVTFNFTYAQGKISLVQKNDGETLKPTYTNGLLTKVEVLLANDVFSYTEYEWLNGKVKNATLYVMDAGQATPFTKFEFSYNAAGNVGTTRAWIYNPLTDQLEYSGKVDYLYDNRENPLNAFSDFMLMVWRAPSANNAINEKHYDDNDLLEQTVEYTYTYDAKGLPTKASVKTTVVGQPAETDELKFIYQ
jgi:hypothetical protein